MLIVIVKVLVISTSTYVVAEVVQHSRVDGFRNNQSGILMIGDKVAGSRGKDHTDVMDGTYKWRCAGGITSCLTDGSLLFFVFF